MLSSAFFNSLCSTHLCYNDFQMFLQCCSWFFCFCYVLSCWQIKIFTLIFATVVHFQALQCLLFLHDDHAVFFCVLIMQRIVQSWYERRWLRLVRRYFASLTTNARTTRKWWAITRDCNSGLRTCRTCGCWQVHRQTQTWHLTVLLSMLIDSCQWMTLPTVSARCRMPVATLSASMECRQWVNCHCSSSATFTLHWSLMTNASL